MYGARSTYVAMIWVLLAQVHLQRWEYCHNTGSDADPAHLLRSANVATSASDHFGVRYLHSPRVLHVFA